MIADLQPYPEYKESGLPWVGRMPAHWSQRRMKFLFRERAQKGFPDEPLLAATQTKGVVRKEDYGERTVTVTKDFHLLKLVETGDFVISLRSFEGGIEVAHCRGIISPAYTVLTPRPEARGSYYTRFFKSPDFIRSLTLFVTGIREGQNIDYERLSRAYMPLPPADEQDLMGRFLDYANGRLERAIRAKRKVIALLNEQKQAIIHRAVTRGLDPTVPLKPSGIPWLGDIPKHWEVLRLKRLGEVKIGLTYSPSDIVGETGTLVLRASNIRNGVIVSADNVYVSKKVPETLLVTEGDILICVRSGSRNLVGKSALITSEVAGVTYGAFMSLLRSKDNQFIFWVLNSNLFARVMAQFETSTINQLTQSDLKNLFIPVPSRTERAEIVAHLKSATSNIETAISRLEREIELLREYRTRLVADVVTGKLDVREVARQLPEEAGKLSDGVDQSDGLDESDLSGETPLE